MIPRVLISFARPVGLLFVVSLWLTGCQGIRYLIPEHSAEAATAPLTLTSGQSFDALKTPARMPVPGGFWLGLASEDPTIVAVETTEGSMGSSRAILHARGEGVVQLHYVNRFVVAEDPTNPAEREQLQSHSLRAFTVIVAPSS